MICTFFGHKDTTENIKEKIKNTIIQLIEKDGIKNFYVGNNGNFDLFVQQILNELIRKYTNLEYYIVLSRIDETAISLNQKATIFPERLENIPPRFAISKRNEWMISKSSFAVCYANHKFSNAFTWIEKAKKKGLEVINLGKQE